MIAPVLLLIAIFTLYPVGRALYQSTRIESPIFPSRFVGLQNYREVLGGLFFTPAAVTTLWFAAVTVPILVALGVLVALLLNEPFHGNALLRIGMLLPWALLATVGALIWKWIFLDSWGALNAGLFAFMLAYSEFLFALFITTTSDRRTLPVILGSLSANTDVTWNMLMASIVVGTTPTLLLAIPVWRFMVRGLTSGAVRG